MFRERDRGRRRDKWKLRHDGTPALRDPSHVTAYSPLCTPSSIASGVQRKKARRKKTKWERSRRKKTTWKRSRGGNGRGGPGIKESSGVEVGDGVDDGVGDGVGDGDGDKKH
ncbi:hypothetical protein PTSG_04418 [Salpingoeca rosetta]|uniref:Uncharacterized protein n=1 Tax=Salpingoeca rosetta (strain ATCC 50818 / BSB-021) TaxID=946362 RepID=F2U8I1_SALR5|nr:uncharacterized protein PTSG_04418 [Salpingoeca rosetta]EGD72689.1 hypothetical protein PTSG_04418 [Salpingoeca rosetta]|eukprot:XP_004994512.1 hypothetical protein PTSG_04418 [Salpingoeca rosetta]